MIDPAFPFQHPAPSPDTTPPLNVAWRLSQMARSRPEQWAVVAARRPSWGRATYRTLNFRDLDASSCCLARGLLRWGMPPGARLVLMVKPGLEFVTWTFALFKAGAVIVLIDPGMGRRHLVACLEAAQPHGFITIPLAQTVRWLLGKRFPEARWNVTVGHPWPGFAGMSQDRLRLQSDPHITLPTTAADDPAAIIFTSGSTGPPKGVLYRHGNFDRQVDEIQSQYRIEPGGCDLSCFPLFALFNAAMGVTTVIPYMDATRPARVDPRNILRAVEDWQITQAFGSPAVWNVVGQYCQQHQRRMPSLQRVLSSGAPVAPIVLRNMVGAIAEGGQMHTPYGATEALPVATIEAREVLGETAAKSATGAGTCVGRRFPGIEWKIIRAHRGPLPDLANVEELPNGQIGELIVTGPVVTDAYVTRIEANSLAKIADQGRVWHRMGDVGYLDEHNRFWFCGRMTHCVHAAHGTMYPICCEAILNQHARIFRSALVGVGPVGSQVPVMICQTWKPQAPRSRADRQQLLAELFQRAQSHSLTRTIAANHIFLRTELPVDVRHNAKIAREALALWAEGQLSRRMGGPRAANGQKKWP